MLNKKGKTSGGLVAGVIIGIVLLSVIAFGVYRQGIASDPTATTAEGCNIAPTLEWSINDALVGSSAVTGIGINARVTNANTGDETIVTGITTSTKFNKGDKVTILANASNFINEIIATDLEIRCGGNVISGELFATSANTIRLFNSDGNPMEDTANNAASGINQSTSATAMNVEVKIDGTNDESTGSLIIVVESVNTTEVDEITLSGLGGVETLDSVPKSYSENSITGASNIVRAFRIPAILKGETVTGNLKATAENGETIGLMTAGNIFYVTAFSEQGFVDRDGTLQVGVEDSLGNIKYEDTWDFDFIAS